MIKRLSYRINATLGRVLPEQRLFLKSDRDARYVRLSPTTQTLACAGLVLVVGWTMIATSILLMDAVSAGSGSEQAVRQQAMYERRLNDLSADRDLRAEEAVRAQGRFNLALAEVSAMQTRLLASEDGRREMETGIDVIQNTLRRTIGERDEARSRADLLDAAMTKQTGSARTGDDRAREAVATLGIMAEALAGTASERDRMALDVDAANAETATIADEKRAMEKRNDVIFSKLEDAVTVSMAPLDKMFRAAGMSPDTLLKAVRKGYGQQAALSPISFSTSNQPVSEDETRANAILKGLDTMNMYRIAAVKSPFAVPVKSSFRYSSGFGYRRDPKGAGTRMHEGTDFAARSGTPIYATADGVVTFAGQQRGYGNLTKIRHAFGVETRYAHQSNIRVKVGQKVSRGDRIGDMGSTGRSTGNHLHYEVRIAGKAVDPMTFIKAAKNVF